MDINESQIFILEKKLQGVLFINSIISFGIALWLITSFALCFIFLWYIYFIILLIIILLLNKFYKSLLEKGKSLAFNYQIYVNISLIIIIFIIYLIFNLTYLPGALNYGGFYMLIILTLNIFLIPLQSVILYSIIKILKERKALSVYLKMRLK